MGVDRNNGKKEKKDRITGSPLMSMWSCDMPSLPGPQALKAKTGSSWRKWNLVMGERQLWINI